MRLNAAEVLDAAEALLERGGALIERPGGLLPGRASILQAFEQVVELGRTVRLETPEHQRAFVLELLARELIANSWYREGPDLAAREWGTVVERLDAWAAAEGGEQVRAVTGDLRTRTVAKLALSLEALGRLDDAEAAYREALADYERDGFEAPQAVSTLEAYGDLLRKRGDLGSALDVLERAQGLAAAAESYELWWNITLRLSQVHADRNDPRHALELASELLGRTLEREPGTRHEAVARGDLGRALEALGDLDGAGEQWERTLALHEAADPESDEVARTVNALGELDFLRAMAAREGDEERRTHLRAAAERFERAAAIRDAVEASPADRSLVLANLAVSRVLLGEHEQARQPADRALALVRASPGYLGTNTLTGLGDALHDLGREDDAIWVLQASITQAESARARAGAGEAPERYFAQRQTAYQRLIAHLFARGVDGDHDEAFSLAERTRARTLSDLLAQRFAPVSGDDPARAELLAREAALRRRLLALYRERRAGAEGDELEAERALEQVQRRLRAHGAAQTPEPLDAGGAAALLDPADLMLAYDATGNECFVWAIRADRRTMRRVEASEHKLLDLMREAVGVYHGPDDVLEAAPLARACAALAERLLGPVPAELWDGVERVVIVPDGGLHYLPFELLPAPDGDGLVADRWAVAYAPSATTLAALRQWSPSWTSTFMGFGDPTFANEVDGHGAEAARTFGLVGVPLERLRGSGEEVRAIAALVGEPEHCLVREAATELSVRRHSFGARFVHLATHALIDDERALYSGFALAPPKADELREDPDLDDLLQAHEMFSLQLSAEAVVCSACQTALVACTRGRAWWA